MSSTAHAVGFSFVERLAQDLRDERLELPAFPEAVIRIQRALQSPDTSTDDVVRILSSEPALAARLLRMANSAEFRRVDQNVTDLRKAVARMGFNMVRSVAVAFAMRQLRRKDTYSPAAQAQLEQAWNSSLEISALCFVIAKRFTRVNPDQALLSGLLHVLGKLYIIMRSKDAAELSDAEMREVIEGWHATIGKAILETWGLPETLQHAVEHQDEYESEFEGDAATRTANAIRHCAARASWRPTAAKPSISTPRNCRACGCRWTSSRNARSAVVRATLALK
jgi:HD-like signal output (HDOD) protein